MRNQIEKELGNVCIYGENHYSVIMANFLMCETQQLTHVL